MFETVSEFWYCHTPYAFIPYDCWYAPIKVLLYAIVLLGLTLWYIKKRKP